MRETFLTPSPRAALERRSLRFAAPSTPTTDEQMTDSFCFLTLSMIVLVLQAIRRGLDDAYRLCALVWSGAAAVATEGRILCGWPAVRAAAWICPAAGSAAGCLRSDDWVAGVCCLDGRAGFRQAIAKRPQYEIASVGCPDKGFRFFFTPVILAVVSCEGIHAAPLAGTRRAIASDCN